MMMEFFKNLRTLHRLDFHFDNVTHPVLKAKKQKETNTLVKQEFPNVFTKHKSKVNSETIGKYNVNTHRGYIHDCFVIEVVDTETNANHIEIVEISSNLSDDVKKALKYKAKAIKELTKRVNANSNILSIQEQPFNHIRILSETAQFGKIKAKVVRIYEWVKIVLISEIIGGLFTWCGEKLQAKLKTNKRKQSIG